MENVFFHHQIQITKKSEEQFFLSDIGDGQPMAAIVTCVHNDRLVNLTVLDHSGTTHSITSVPLVQPDEEVPSGFYCHWMPYQVGQSAKNEELQRQLDGGPVPPEVDPTEDRKNDPA